jgi:glycosyl transferase family 25
MSKINAILYINLEHRTDRDVHVRNELRKLCPDESKIHRIDAVKKNPGALGCSKSHIKALEYALAHNEWENILIVEDDFTFKSDNPVEIQATVDLFLKDCGDDIDVGLLSHHHTHIKFNDTHSPIVKRFNYSQTTSSYIIKKHYIPILLQNFTESMTDMERHGLKHENSLDIHWTQLMKKDVWYGIYPAIGYQCEGHSDIQNGIVNYRC